MAQPNTAENTRLAPSTQDLAIKLGIRRARRTLARLARLANKVPAEVLAKALSPPFSPDVLGYDIRRLEDYLHDVAELRDGLKERKCAGCGRISLARNARTDTRYCSPGCRQKAHRKRVTAHTSPATLEASRGNGSSPAENNLAVTAADDWPDIPDFLRRAAP